MDEPVWVPNLYNKNRDRLLDGDIAQALFAELLEHARAEHLMSEEHFSVNVDRSLGRPEELPA